MRPIALASVLAMTAVLAGHASGAGVASTTTAAASDPAPALGAWRADESPRRTNELPAMRTEHSRTWALDDGTRQTIASSRPLNVRAATGWLPVETRVRPAPGRPGWVADRLPYLGSFDAEGTYRFQPDRERGDTWVELDSPFEDDTPQVDGDGSITWREGSSAMRVDVLEDRLKGTILLDDATAPTTWRFAVRTAPGLAVDERLTVRRVDGTPVALIELPYAIDADGERRDVEWELQGADLVLTLDTRGLAYPIEVDPTVTYPNSASLDDVQVAGAAGVNNCTTTTPASTTLRHGWNQATSQEWDYALRIPSVTVPQAADVTGARLMFVKAGWQLSQGGTGVVWGANVYYQAVDNATALDGTCGNLTARSLTFSGGAVGHQAGLGGWEWADVPTAVQALVDRPGWSSGNAMYWYVNGGNYDGTTWHKEFGAWDHATYSPPQLEVTWTPVTPDVAISNGGTGAWLKSDGTVWTYGRNTDGSMAQGSLLVTASSLAPRQVLTAAATPLTGVTKIAGSDNHFVALRSDGTVWTWGHNNCGQAMTGNFSHQPYATQARLNGTTYITGAVAVAAGYDTMVLLADGRILSSDAPPDGGSCQSYPQYVTYDGTTQVTDAIAIDSFRTDMFVRSNGTAWAWNYYNGNGQVANGTADGAGQPYPGQMLTGPGTPITNVVQVSSGTFSSFVRRSDGTVWGTGYDGWGELSNNTVAPQSNYLVPMQAPFGTNFTTATDVSGSNGQWVLVRRSDATVWATGMYQMGQLGNNLAGGGDPMFQVLAGYAGFDAHGNQTTNLMRTDGTAAGTGFNRSGETGACHSRVIVVPVAVPASCVAPYAPFTPYPAAQTEDDGSAMRCGGPADTCWTNDGISNFVRFSFTIFDQDTSDTLTPRFQLVNNATTFTVTDACATNGSPLAAQPTTSSNQQVVVNHQVTGLVHGTQYRWRACVLDSGSRASGWATFSESSNRMTTDSSFGIDNVLPTAPTIVRDGPGATDIDYVNATTSLQANHAGATDATSGVWGVSSCVTTSPTGADCATTAVQTWTSYSGSSEWTITGLPALTDGQLYYVCAKTEDYAKNASAAHSCSDGVSIDRTGPGAPNVNDGAAADVDWFASTTTWSGNWTAGTETGSGVADHDWCITLSSTGADCVAGAVRTWTASATASFSVAALALSTNTRYFTCARSRDNVGNVGTVGCSDGAWVNMNAPTISQTSPAGGATNQSLTPTLQALYGDADGTAGTVDFQVCSDAACTGVVTSGSVLGVANGGTASWVVSPGLAGNTTYWWRVNATDAGARSTGFTATRSFTTVNAPTIIDNDTGDATWRNTNTRLWNIDYTSASALTQHEVSAWTGAAQTGTNVDAWRQVSTLSGNSYTTDWLLPAATWSALAEGINYVSVRASNASASATLVDAFTVYKDTVATPAASVADGTGADVDWQNSTTTLAANWPTVTDAGSGLLRYEYCMSTGALCTGTILTSPSYEAIGTSTSVSEAVTLTHGTTYRTSVRVIDNLNNTSVIVGSDAVTVDTVAPPAVGTLDAPATASAPPVLTWTTVADALSGTAYYRVYRSTSSGTLGSQVNADGATTTGTYTDTSISSSGTYWYTVRAVDRAGNEQTAGNNQDSTAYVAPLYLRSSASAMTNAWEILTTAGVSANDTTSLNARNNIVGFMPWRSGSSWAPPTGLTAPATPTGNGWLYDPATGEAFSAGNWRFHVTTTTNRTHTGYVNVRAWKVTLSGGTINTSSDLSGGWVQGTTNVGAMTTTQNHYVDVAMGAMTFAAGEFLFVEYANNVSVDTGCNCANIDFRAETSGERIEPPPPPPSMSVTNVTPASAPQGRRGLAVTIDGTGFQAGATVAISGTGVTASVTGVTATQVSATFDVTGSAALGARNVTVTNPDLSTATMTSGFTVTAPSISIVFSSLGFTDAARDSAAPWAVDFGLVSPGTTRDIGPGGSGQTLAGPAVRIAITSDTTTQTLTSATAWSGPAAMPLATSLLWKPAASGTWTGYSTTDAITADNVAPGTPTQDYDMRLVVPGAQLVGSYQSTATWTVIAKP